MKKQRMKSVIISYRPGQLGNMLFLFSNFIAWGIEKNVCVKAPAFEKYAEYFNSTQYALTPSYPSRNSLIKSTRLRKLIFIASSLSAKIIFRLKLNNRLFSSINIDWNESLNLEDEATVKLFNSRFIFIQGWLYRSRSFVGKHKKEIVAFFTPTDVHQKRINKLIPSNHEIIIGIHIRHGDYKTFEGGKYYYSVDQYKEIMQRISALFPSEKITFLVCSNSKEIPESLSSMNIIKGTNHELEDLYAFSKCDYLAGPPSTYTMWASYYGDVPLYQVHNPDAVFTIEDFKIIKS